MKKDGGGRNYQAVQEVEKEYPPDVDAIKYLLTVKFGREFHPKKEELDLADKKAEPVEWLPKAKDSYCIVWRWHNQKSLFA